MRILFPEMLTDNSLCTLYLKVIFAGYKILGSHCLEYFKFVASFPSGMTCCVTCSKGFCHFVLFRDFPSWCFEVCLHQRGLP